MDNQVKVADPMAEQEWKPLTYQLPSDDDSVDILKSTETKSQLAQGQP